MTIAWAIIIVAVLFLLDRHHLLKKALVATGITAGIAALLLAVGYAGVLGYQWLRGRWEAHQLAEKATRLAEQARWEDHQFAQQNDCFDLVTGDVHPINESKQEPDSSETWETLPPESYNRLGARRCKWIEEIHKRGTPLPPLLPSCGNALTDASASSAPGLPEYLVMGSGKGDGTFSCVVRTAPHEPIITKIVLNNHAYMDRSKIGLTEITKANNAFVDAFNHEPACAGLSLTVDYVHPFENPPPDDEEQYWDLSIAPELAGYQTEDGRIFNDPTATVEHLEPVIKLNWYTSRHGFGRASEIDTGVYHDIVRASDVCKRIKKYNHDTQERNTKIDTK